MRYQAAAAAAIVAGFTFFQSCPAPVWGAHIKVTGDNPKFGIKITGIPYSCISAAPWFDGVGTVPFACGDDCLQYTDLTNDEYTQVRQAFLNKAHD
ncbi:hypothetical protein F5Y00DRAFT_261955 [Daldinia vernicosa]|uniref:uncharacterized protein n=1 Tax=Daldinia vernicosa TaxID=114800 RepID=UPI002008C930|nr:uncharacterized protein F5Y00DRAFT_261955 [Daldinia vernicosa]KAI0849139.1 hypothetical protein F5Y00DRAFT_261955 [Daldinia vernicosa]